MTRKRILPALITSLLASTSVHASVDLVAVGSIDGNYEDLSSQTAAPLENGVAGNRLGGVGSGFAYAGGTTFLALPDRGPNANAYNDLVDDTVSYIDRFHSIKENVIDDLKWTYAEANNRRPKTDGIIHSDLSEDELAERIRIAKPDLSPMGREHLWEG